MKNENEFWFYHKDIAQDKFFESTTKNTGNLFLTLTATDKDLFLIFLFRYTHFIYCSHSFLVKPLIRTTRIGVITWIFVLVTEVYVICLLLCLVSHCNQLIYISFHLQLTFSIEFAIPCLLIHAFFVTSFFLITVSVCA